MSAEVAVVIPTRDREIRLAFALDGLAQQTLARDRYEVIVVRGEDASGPRAEAPEGLVVRFESSPNSSPAAMRNVGWRSTEAPLVAFMDDDCRPAPGWLAAILAASRGRGERTVLLGRTEPDPDERHRLVGLARTVQITAPTGFFETCNIAYNRSLLTDLGGFYEGFAVPWGEDTDLGLRASEQGAEAIFVDDALVWHAVHSRPLHRAVRETARRGHLPQLLARHPELRDRLFAGLFIKESHAAITAAAAGGIAGIAIGGRRGRVVAAASALPYLQFAMRGLVSQGGPITPRRLARFAVHLPAAAAVDLAETVATVRGALRYRTPVV